MIRAMEQHDLVVSGGRVVTPSGVISADVGIAAGRIVTVGAGLAGAETLDAGGQLVTPGGVDPHCHIEQMSGMGLMNADDWDTATRSAAMGGVTTVISHVPQLGMGLRDAVRDYAERARLRARIDHAWHMIIADTSVAGFAEDIAGLMAEGHRTVKLFTTYNIGLTDRQILEAMAAAKAGGGLVCVHAENDAMIGFMKDRLAAAGLVRPAHHALSHPRLAEVEAVERMCRFAEFLDQPLMIFHISTREGVEAVARAKARGVPVWAETCTHYLYQTEAVLERDGMEGAKWMCSPPQRRRDDIDALWQGLEDGVLSYVSSDHAPFRFDETGKLANGPDAPFAQIANGMPGLEVRGPLLLEAFKDRPERFVDLTSSTPARLYGLDSKGEIAPGKDADLVIWGDRPHTYGPDDLHDNVGYNPFEGETVSALPETVILRGRVIVSGGGCHAAPGSGQWLPRQLATPATGHPAPELTASGDWP